MHSYVSTVFCHLWVKTLALASPKWRNFGLDNLATDQVYVDFRKSAMICDVRTFLRDPAKEFDQAWLVTLENNSC